MGIRHLQEAGKQWDVCFSSVESLGRYSGIHQVLIKRCVLERKWRYLLITFEELILIIEKDDFVFK